MNSRIGFCFAFMFALVMVAAMPAQTQEQSALIKEIDEQGVRMDRALVDGNYDSVMTFYADDAIVLPSNGEKLVGKQAIRENYSAQTEAGLDFISFTGKTDEAWECGGRVYAVGTYALSVKVPGAPQPISDAGKFMTVYRREPGGALRILYDIWNSDLPIVTEAPQGGAGGQSQSGANNQSPSGASGASQGETNEKSPE